MIQSTVQLPRMLASVTPSQLALPGVALQLVGRQDRRDFGVQRHGEVDQLGAFRAGRRAARSIRSETRDGRPLGGLVGTH